jgi:hypothetical protein
MTSARKFKPHWDDAFYLERALPDREKKPRVQAEIIRLPKSNRLDAARAVKAWADTGLDISEARLKAHWEQLKNWQVKPRMSEWKPK